MYYFDRDYLIQYLGISPNVKVYANGEYLSISDPNDLAHMHVGVGYTEDGEPLRFDYQEVEQVKVGETIMTLDMLQREIEKIKNPDSIDDTEETEEEDQESDTGGGSGVDNDFSVSGGGDGGDMGDIGGDMGGDADFGDTEGGGELDLDIEEPAGDSDVEEPEEDTEEEPETTADSIIRTGQLIINETIAEGVPGRYGKVEFVDSDLITYSYYDPIKGKEVLGHMTRAAM